jgi:uncharacterized protein YggE
METYVEVIGSADHAEVVSEFRADVTLVVRASKSETAVREALELRAECIRKLRESGLADGELQEGGAQAWRPWFWKKAVGQEAAQKILVSCADVQHLYQALSSLEPLFENQRYTISVDMRRPRFSSDPSSKQTTRRAAIADARAKAEAIAAEAGLRVTGVTQVEELHEQAGRSGMYGDEDWRGPMVIDAAWAPSDGGQYEPLENASRMVTIRCRVRFSVEPA